MPAIFYFACFLLLSGCFAFRPSVQPEQPSPTAKDLTPAAKFITENTPGATATVFDAAFGGQARISVEEEFPSASGKICRRAAVSRQSRETEFVVFCRTDSGWEMMPRIWGGKTE